MIFDLPNYYNSMDRGYNHDAPEGRPLAGLEIKDIGISANPMANQLDGLKARIFQGASAVELGFSGHGKGSMGGQNTTPEMYGKDEREDIAALAKINRVKLSTHASFNIGPLSGMGQQGFDHGARENTLREIERAIDFAADTAKGGAVVVHTGEFPRALSEAFPGQFQMFEKEKDEATMHLVDSQTGQIIQSVKKNQPVVMPEFVGEKINKKGEIDMSGVDPIEEQGWWPNAKFDEEKTGEFLVKERTWDQLEKIRDWYNTKARKAAIDAGKEPPKEMTTEEVAYRASIESRRQYALGWAKDYADRYRQSKHTNDFMRDILPKLDSLDKDYSLTPEQENMLINSRILPQQFAQMTTEDKVKKLAENDSTIKKQITAEVSERFNDSTRSMNSSREASVSQFQQAKEYENMENRAVPIKEFALQRTAETIATAAEFAHKKTEMLRGKGQLSNAIYVAPENIFPETFGSHPEELKRIIRDAREKYVDKYTKDYGEDKAKKLAAEHIKATFDVGHAYTWRKYYKEDPGKSYDENEKDFQKWLMGQVDDLNKKGYIGHVHVSDNFGWEDEHVTPGQGRVPIKDFVEKMKKAGIAEVTVEPAHQDYKAVLGGWREFGSPIYGSMDQAKSWTDIQFSYFGKTRSPYFIFGEYSPSQDFTLWTQVPLE